MNRLNKLAMLATVTLLSLPAAAASAQPGPPPGPGPVIWPPQPGPPGVPTGPVMPLEYAAKFVCGENIAPGASSTQVAFGRYYTAVNIHNPNRRNRMTYKVVWARAHAQLGAMTNFQAPIDLPYDQALDIDCRLIRARLQQAGIILGPPNVFITGFLVVQSSEELDVVAVYTAAPTTTNQVATMHTERVPVRRLRD